MTTILVVCIIATVVCYAIYKNYTVRAGGKAFGAALFFEASKRSSGPGDNDKAMAGRE